MTASTGYRIAWGVLRALRGVLLTTTAVLGVVSIVAVAAGLVLDVRPLVVISGSMEPAIPVGSLIAGRTVPAADLEVGDVVTVPRRAGTTDLVTHRIVEIREVADGTAAPGTRELVLRGDANATDDATPYSVTEARRQVATVPGGGYLVQTLRSTRGMVVLAGVLLAAVVLTFAVPRADEPERAPRPSGRHAAGPGPAEGAVQRRVPAHARDQGRHREPATSRS